VRESVRGYAEGVLEPAAAGEVTRVADEIGGFSSTLAASADLRGVLTDPTIAGHIRRTVVTDLLSSRALGQTTRIVALAAESGRPTEFVDDIASLVARVRRVADGSEPVASDGPIGRHAAEERLDGYVRAVVEETPDPDDVARAEDELYRFLHTVTGNENLEQALTDRDVPTDARAGVVRDLLGGRAVEATVRLSVYSARMGRPRDYPALLQWLVDRVAAERQRRIADVRAAVDLDQPQRQRLAEALTRITGRPVDLRVSADPAVLGGFVATIGDTVVDGSVRHRLDLLKERLVITGATITTGESS